MRLLRHILITAIVPSLALLLASVFAPAGPPTASAASDSLPAVEICQGEPAGWLETILHATGALFC